MDPSKVPNKKFIQFDANFFAYFRWPAWVNLVKVENRSRLHCLNVGGGIGVNYKAYGRQQFNWPSLCQRLNKAIHEMGNECPQIVR